MFDVGCFQPTTKIQYLVLVEMGHFFVTQKVSDLVAGNKNRLTADTKNCFCSSESSDIYKTIQQSHYYMTSAKHADNEEQTKQRSLRTRAIYYCIFIQNV
jgi:hypothetical protein